MLKRLFDFSVSVVAWVLLAPLLIFIALWIKCDSPGPVFYRGVRIGRGGRPFRIYKFRSMVVNAHALGGSTTSQTDPRVTHVGRIVRRYKLDELPQLINIVCGEMSFVGPRPQVGWMVDGYSEEERTVLALRPGITDWASMRFHNEDEIVQQSGIADADEAYIKLIHPEKMRLQIRYLHERSMGVDLQILWQTVATLLRTRRKPPLALPGASTH
jgi:lipopolysaccharide/colanic/teichoic acid biosynthesis glycosyltransferase